MQEIKEINFIEMKQSDIRPLKEKIWLQNDKKCPVLDVERPLDKSRGYYGIKFSTDDSEVKYGKVTCSNSGNDYDSHYFERTFYRWCFYHKHPSWDKTHKAKLCNFYKFIVKVPLDMHVQEK